MIANCISGYGITVLSPRFASRNVTSGSSQSCRRELVASAASCSTKRLTISSTTRPEGGGAEAMGAQSGAGRQAP